MIRVAAVARPAAGVIETRSRPGPGGAHQLPAQTSGDLPRRSSSSRRNAEGRLAVIGPNQKRAAEGLPFVGSTVTELLTRRPMASQGAVCLDLAWQHRELLLGSAS